MSRLLRGKNPFLVKQECGSTPEIDEKNKKCAWRESNPRQTRFRKPPLYPTELQAQILFNCKLRRLRSSTVFLITKIIITSFIQDMKINSVNTTSFKGYDARPLKGFFMNTDCRGIAQEMKAIGKKEGFKIFSVHKGNRGDFCSASLPEYRKDSGNVWAQDSWTFLKNKLLVYEKSSLSDAVKDFFRLEYDRVQTEKRDEPAMNALWQDIKELYSDISYFNQTDDPFEQIQQSMMMIDYDNKKEVFKRFLDSTHVSGGNVFITKNKVLMGEKELENFSESELEKMFNTDKIVFLPQMDFHLDLFIRPLDNNRVLLADDKLTRDTILSGMEKLVEFLKTQPPEERQKYKDTFVKMGSVYQTFDKLIFLNKFPKADDVEKKLNENGFEVIRVPGRLYNVYENKSGKQSLRHHCNYMNANVFLNKDGDLVYITNKSNIDEMLGLTPEISEKIGFSFENAFIESISPYIKKDKIYFIRGEDDFLVKEMLPEYQGGIHCACAEIPEE